MERIITTYDRPREKLQQKGVAALNTSELLQVLIGSGNGQVSVSRIAKRTLRVLSRHGNGVTFSDLLSVLGLGPARASQIMAAFELASRYPSTVAPVLIDSAKPQLHMEELRHSSVPRLIYITVDGARRLIAKRELLITELTHPSTLLRKIFGDVASDNAAGLFIGVGQNDRDTSPTMFDLSFARDLHAMAQLFLVTIHGLVIINSHSHYFLKKES